MLQNNILMLPSWWPKNDSVGGSFFKEQALAITEFDFTVLLITEKKLLFPLYYLKKIFNLSKPKIQFGKKYQNIQEVEIIISLPKFFFYNIFLFKRKMKKGLLKDGIGSCIPKSIINAYNYAFNSINKKISFTDFDCIYGLSAQDVSVKCNLISKKFNIPYILAEHGPFPWPGSTVSDAEAEAFEKADLFLAISNDKIRQIMLQNLKIKPWYVGNLVDDSRFTNSPIEHADKTFLIVAANSFYKNYDLFIQSMEYLLSITNHKFKIIIAGYGANKGYSKNVELFEERIKNSTINSITTLIPSISRDEIPSLYNKADAFVLTSIQEGMPVSALEAAMSGLPIFSTRCGGIEDYIDDENGRIVSIIDYKSLANYCKDFIENKIQFDSQVIRDKVLSQFGKDAFVKNITKAFNSVINKD